MAWIKVPPEHHPLFRAALPSDPRVQTIDMFGGIAAKVNGNMFAGLFARSAMVYLNEPRRSEALALDGAAWFDPMGNGRKSDKVMLPESIMDEPGELRAWLRDAFDAALTLPRKTVQKSAKKPASKSEKPAAKVRAKKPAKRAATRKRS